MRKKPGSLRQHGIVTSRADSLRPIILATDGSSRGSIHSSAYIATTGAWGVDAAAYGLDRCKPQCALATELRAVYHGLSHLALDTSQVVIHTDSTTTKRWLERWAEGHTAMPRWYSQERSGEQLPTINRLQSLVQANAGRLSVEHIPGHSGDLLNEAADGLAGIGTRRVMGHYEAEDAMVRCSGLAASFLLSYAQDREL